MTECNNVATADCTENQHLGPEALSSFHPHCFGSLVHIAPVALTKTGKKLCAAAPRSQANTHWLYTMCLV